MPTLWGFRITGNGNKELRVGHLVDALSSVPNTILGFRVLGFTKTPLPKAQVCEVCGASTWNNRSEEFRTRRSE